MKPSNIISISLFVILGLVLFSCKEKSSTNFYLVRHAEKEDSNTMQDQNEDPPLNQEGMQRVKKLKDLLIKENISAIYSTSYRRNLNTVKPMAQQRSLKIKNYEWYEWRPMIDEILKDFNGETIVICGHGDNLLPMIDYLGGTRPQEKLGSNEYDKIFKVEKDKIEAIVNTIIY